MRGLETFNLFKRVVWSCATFRPNGEKDEFCEVNLPLLKGYLFEIKYEIYVEDLLLKMQGDPNHKDVDVKAISGFSDYKRVTDHSKI